MKKEFSVLDYLNDALSCQEDFYQKNNGTMLNDDLRPYSGQLSIIFRSLKKAKEIMERELTKKTLYVTNEVPADAVILLVDMQEKYFREVLDYLEPEVQLERSRKVDERLQQMREQLIQLKTEGHKIYAVVDQEGIHPTLSGIPDVFLPSWEYGRTEKFKEESDPAEAYILHPTIIAEMKKAKTVLVCGLWLELCVYSVARLLQKEGIRSIVSVEPTITLENSMIWDEEDEDVVTLSSECDRHGIQICQIESF